MLIVRICFNFFLEDVHVLPYLVTDALLPLGTEEKNKGKKMAIGLVQ